MVSTTIKQVLWHDWVDEVSLAASEVGGGASRCSQGYDMIELIRQVLLLVRLVVVLVREASENASEAIGGVNEASEAAEILAGKNLYQQLH